MLPLQLGYNYKINTFCCLIWIMFYYFNKHSSTIYILDINPNLLLFCFVHWFVVAALLCLVRYYGIFFLFMLKCQSHCLHLKGIFLIVWLIIIFNLSKIT